MALKLKIVGPLFLLITISSITPSISLNLDESTAGSLNAPVLGTIDVTVVLAQTSDEIPARNLTYFSRIMTENISTYFQKQSYSKFDVNGRIVNWTKIPESSDFYKTDRRQLFNDAVEQVMWTSENFTDHVIVVRSGSSYIRACYFEDPQVTLSVDGETIEVRGVVVAEDHDWTVWCHEIGHTLGLEDLYVDDNYDHLGEFVGPYDLMAQHGWFSDPSDLSAYSRIQLGWLTSEQVFVVNTNLTVEIGEINSMSDEPKAVRVHLDDFRYYLLEARVDGLDSGMLVHFIDERRVSGGLGLVEVVRTYRSINSYRGEDSIFRVGETYTDSRHGVQFEVLAWDHEILRISTRFGEFGLIDLAAPLGVGEIIDLTSFKSSNGTDYIGIVSVNASLGLRQIHLYRFENGFQHIANSSLNYDSFNPTIVEGHKSIGLIYERVKNQHHEIVGQHEDYVSTLSGDDDARNPTAICTYNELLVAYENHSSIDPNIAILRGSSRLSYGVSVDKRPILTIHPASGHQVSLPNLKENYYSVLSYLNRSQDGLTLEVLYGSDFTTGNISLPISDSSTYSLGYFSPQFLSIVYVSNPQTIDCVLIDTYWDKTKATYRVNGRLVGGVFASGQWIVIEKEGQTIIQRLFNRHYETEAEIPLDLVDVLFMGQVSQSGSPSVFFFANTSAGYSMRVLVLCSVPFLDESRQNSTLIVITMTISVATLIALVYYLRKRIPGEQTETIDSEA